MLVPTLIMGVLATILIFIAYFRGEGGHIRGMRISLDMLIQILPLLIFAFIVAGMIQTLVPRELLSKLLGVKSGFRGIIIGAVIGGVAPGGPYVSLSIVAALL